MKEENIIRKIRDIKDKLDDLMTVYGERLEKVKSYEDFKDSWELLYKTKIDNKDDLIGVTREFNTRLTSLLNKVPDIKNEDIVQDLLKCVKELWALVAS